MKTILKVYTYGLLAVTIVLSPMWIYAYWQLRYAGQSIGIRI